MQQRKIGHLGETSVLGIGAMSFSDFYGETDEAASHAILDRALDAGVSHIDTANIYGMGKSEKAIGTWFKANPGKRDKMFLATKAGISSGIGAAARGFDNAPAYLEDCLNDSLARLGVDHVDLFYIHRRDQNIEIEEVCETLAQFVKAGKIRGFGFSEIAPHSLRRAAKVHPVAAVQSEYSLQTRQPELGLTQACAALNTALVAFSPVGRGMLTDRPHDAAKVATMPWMANNPRFSGQNLLANIAATAPFRAYARDLGLSAAGLAIAWVHAQGDHIVSIPGTRSVAHFEELIAGARAELSADQLAEISRLLPVGWAHGDRYAAAQWAGPENYC